MAERKTAGNSKRESKKKAEKIFFNMKDHEVKVLSAHQFDNGNISFDLQIDEIKIYRLTVVRTKDDTEFISFPSYQSGDKYYNYAFVPFTDEDQDAIIDMVYDSLDD